MAAATNSICQKLDENFMIYRRFGYLQSRVLLDKQNELQDLEVMLDAMDKDDNEEDPGCLNIADLNHENPSPRKSLLGNIERKFNEYGESGAA
ncbi:MAG: hypothetical protein Q9160_007244 [Pyrenula sp. 1 TL-2023]